MTGWMPRGLEFRLFVGKDERVALGMRQSEAILVAASVGLELNRRVYDTGSDLWPEMEQRAGRAASLHEVL